MVVSDIGDKLSPKKLPQTIAPNIKAGLQFIIVVNGKNIGLPFSSYHTENHL